MDGGWYVKGKQSIVPEVFKNSYPLNLELNQTKTTKRLI